MPEETETIELQQSEALLQSPFCRELRSKRYYFRQEMATEARHLLDAGNYCWCRQTMQSIGPDGEYVHPKECGPERACYRSAFASNE